MRIVYYSLTGQTARLAGKFKNPLFGSENLLTEISNANPFVSINEPYLLLVPSYEEPEVEDIFCDFLETENNLSHCIGMIGSGNINFGDLFLVTAKRLRESYNLPILYELEFHGTPRDIFEIENMLDNKFSSMEG